MLLRIGGNAIHISGIKLLFLVVYRMVMYVVKCNEFYLLSVQSFPQLQLSATFASLIVVFFLSPLLIFFHVNLNCSAYFVYNQMILNSIICFSALNVDKLYK